jgi:putative endonuclease
MAQPPKQSPKKQLGDRGEALVAQWLRRQGWHILAQQWHCRWGELDLVAYHPLPQVCLAFVEVKTRRRRGSLDQAGRLAITPQKQRKLWRSAEHFLHQHPHYGDLPCRFDVALVASVATPGHPPLSTQQGLALVEYIEDAFRLE